MALVLLVPTTSDADADPLPGPVDEVVGALPEQVALPIEPAPPDVPALPVPGEAPADTALTRPPAPPAESAPPQAPTVAFPSSSTSPPPANVVNGGDARQDRNSDNRSEDAGKTANHTTSGDTDTAVVASDTQSDFQAHTDGGDTRTNGAPGFPGRVSSTGGEPNTTETLGLIAVLTAILIAVLLAWSKLFPGNTA